MKLILDFDDLHWLDPENCLSTIDILIQIIPNIKISFFTIPYLRNRYIYENKKWCERIYELIKNNNIRLCVHGYQHTMLEFENISYEDAKEKIIDAENIFNKANLPFLKVFKGPNWGLNLNTLKSLEDLKYTHIFNHNDHKYLENNSSLKMIYYNWNLKDEFKMLMLANENIVYGHGHTWEVCNNGIASCVDKIFEMHTLFNPEYLFPDEVLDEVR